MWFVSTPEGELKNRFRVISHGRPEWGLSIRNASVDVDMGPEVYIKKSPPLHPLPPGVWGYQALSNS